MPASKLSAIKREKAKREFKRFEMRIIPKGCMRDGYAWGDSWVDEHGILQIRAVEFAIIFFSYYILLHEYLEAIRCYRDGISLESIEKWDFDHADHDDPGCLPGAPYHLHHGDSMTIERIAVLQDGYTWDEYRNAEPKEGN